MIWSTIVWPMVAAACLTLVVSPTSIRRSWTLPSLIFSMSALATAAMAACEMWIVRADSPRDLVAALRAMHVSVYVLIVSLVAFVRVELRAGRPWLAWGICGLHGAWLALGCLRATGVEDRATSGLRHITFLGDLPLASDGPSTPWALIGQLSLALIVVFVIDATVMIRRRGERRRAIVVAAGIASFVVLGAAQALLSLWGFVDAPLFPSLACLGIVGGLAYEPSQRAVCMARPSPDPCESGVRSISDLVVAPTELARTEQALRTSEARHRAFLANSSESIWRFDVHPPIPTSLPVHEQVERVFERAVLAECNSEKARLCGFATVEQAVGVRLAEVMPPSNPENMQLLVAFVRSGYRLTNTESVERDRAGGLRRSQNNLVGIVERGLLSGAWAASRDVTAEKQAEERFRLMVEASPTAMVMVNAEGSITLVNAQAETVFAYSRDELLGRPIELVVPERFRAQHPSERQRYVAHSTSRAMGAGRELFARRKDGSEVPVEIGLSPIRMPEGPCVLASIVDITPRKRAEAETMRQRAEMAHLSRVTMLGELSGSIAHELNQPLTAILSNAQAAQRFLAHEPFDLAEVRDILADIVEQDHRAGEIIRRIRLLVKKGEVQREPLDVNALVEEVLQLTRVDVVSQGVAVHTTLASALPPVDGDRLQLQQVLLNLVMNACDATAGNATADRRVEVCTTPSDAEHVSVSVSDNGAGIPPEGLDRVFEPFFTTKTYGLGLGLSVCRTIVGAHGGRLWASNNPVRGAAFHFTLPIRGEEKP
jgi:two-component system, LuxR family, sensor kinase FixL